MAVASRCLSLALRHFVQIKPVSMTRQSNIIYRTKKQKASNRILDNTQRRYIYMVGIVWNYLAVNANFDIFAAG